MEEDTIKDCLDRWKAQDSMIESFSQNFNEWMSQFPEDLKSIIRELLKHFEYYSQQRMNSYAVPYFHALLDEIDFYEKKAVFSPLKFREDHPDSSTMFSYEFIFINKLTEEDWCQTKSQQKELFKKAQIIVVVDDICGSGKTFNDFMQDNCDLLKGKEVVYIVYHFMKNARPLIDESAKRFGVHLHVIYQQAYEKGFSLISPVHSPQEDIRTFCEFSEKVGVSGKYVLGFQDSEALVSFHHDTPNDTLGLFWFKRGQYWPIFPGKEFRSKTKTLQASQEKRALLKKMSYGTTKERNQRDR